MRNFFKALITGSTLINFFLFGQVNPYDSGGLLMPEQAAYDVTFYDLDLKIFPETHSISGQLTAVADILDTLTWFVMDLDPLLSIDSVNMLNNDGNYGRLSFNRQLSKVWIELPEAVSPGQSIEVMIAYGGAPRVAPSPPWEGGFNWSFTGDGLPWIGVSCEGEGADIWWPCKDHPSDEPDSMALHITVPEPLICAANGQLINIAQNNDNTRTFHWFISTPINNYGVSINIAPYVTIEGTFNSVTAEVLPVTFWVLPEAYENAQLLFPQILDQLAFLEEFFGPYPFRADKYGIAQTDYLGMEHQTIISYGADFQNNGYGFDDLHLHELSHEWWGNLVTAADWKDIWLHEGFATYTEALYAEYLHGNPAYHGYLTHFPTFNNYPVAPLESHTFGEMYSPDIYYKGALILHTLRYLVGDDIFFTVLRRMAYPDPQLEFISDGQQCRLTTTDDFKEIAELYSELDLAWFFNVYLHQPELPTLIYSEDNGVLVLSWEAPDNLPFSMPVEVKIGNDTIRVEMIGGTGSVEFGANDYIIDPENWILKGGIEMNIAKNNGSLPQSFRLFPNYPNPFNPVTGFSFQLPESDHVNLSIYNISGQLIETLINRKLPAGIHRVEWHAEGVSSGLYFYKIMAGEHFGIGKCLLVK